jgi:hypothetical protein
MLRTDLRSLLVVAAGLALSLASLACGDDDTGDDGSADPMTSSTSSEPASEGSTQGGEPGTSTGSPSTESGEEPPGGSSSGDESGEPPACAGEVACEDALVLDLGFVEGVVSEGAVESTPDGSGFVSRVDASAGGLPGAPTNPWIYLRFGEGGLERVDIDDFQSLESHDWNIAAKRFAIRLNSGTAGPSCVHGAALDGTDYEDVTEVPAGTELAAEAFFDDECTLVDDGSGQGAPAYLLTPWWTYPGCVATTGVPFVLGLSDGRTLKLVIDAYYAEGQAECNEMGAMGQDSAHFTWRWSFLE